MLVDAEMSDAQCDALIYSRDAYETFFSMLEENGTFLGILIQENK